MTRYLQSLNDDERRRLEAKAFHRADRMHLEAFERARAAQVPLLIETYRRIILEHHVVDILTKSDRKSSKR